MKSSSRIALSVSLAALFSLALAASAAAAVTSSQISSPTSPDYVVYDGDASSPTTIAVAGTTNGTTGDEVDLDCFYGTEYFSLAEGVAVSADGSFSDPAAELENIAEEDLSPCRLRAVPAATVPADLSNYGGPVIAAGYRSSDTIGSGPNSAATYDFWLYGQQLAGGIGYGSLGGCGIAEAGLSEPASLAYTTTTFACADWLGETSTRSELQIDGSDAYAPTVAADINSQAEPGFPALSYSYSQDPATGDMTIHEAEPLVRCPEATFPPGPTSCPSFLDTGVRDERTIVQEGDGRLITVTDRFTSTDGRAHSLDLLWENGQFFGVKNPYGSSPVEDGAGEDIAYRFPGQSTFSTHAEGATVALPSTAPASIFIRVQGAPDGDTATGQGAIVLDRPASSATFDYVDSEISDFYLHQVGTVPAGGATSFRAAYAQAYTSAEVEALARQAEDSFEPPPTPTPTPTPAAPVKHPSSLKLTKVKLNKKKGTAVLSAQVSGPGALTLTGKGIVKAKRASHGVSIVKLAVKANGKAKQLLSRKGKAKVKARVLFTPQGGAALSATKSILLKKQLRR